jgi:hypothetical protein
VKYEEFHINDFSHGYDSNSSPEELPDNSIAVGSSDVMLDGTAIRKRNGYSLAVTETFDTVDTDGYDETLALAQFHDPAEIRCLIRIARNSSSDAIRFEYNDVDLPGTEADIWNEGTTMLVDSATFSGADEEYCTTVSGYSATNGPALYVACPGFIGASTNSPVKYLTYAAGFTVRSMTTSGSTRTLSKPMGIELWYDRIWVFCRPVVEQGTFLLYSDVNGQVFDLGSTGTWLQVPGDGPITAIKRLGRQMLVFKASSIYVLSGGEDPTNRLRINQLSSDTGCIARRSVVEVDGLVYWMGERGFYRTDGYKIDFIGLNIEPEIQDVDRTLIDRTHAIHNKPKSQVAWFIPVQDGVGEGYGLEPYGLEPYGSGTSSQRCLVYDYQNSGWCAPYSNQRFYTSCIFTNSVSVVATDRDIIVVGGIIEQDIDGAPPSSRIYQWDDGLSDNGQTINAVMVTKPFSLGDPAQQKHLRKLHYQVGVETEAVPMTIEVFSDYGRLADDPDDYTEFTLNENGLDDVVYTQTRATLNSQGTHFQFRIYDRITDQDEYGIWSLHGLCGLFTRKGRRL